jgi:predicted 3-demethylubiquinone-9 3-methyltransferase (glyoxalase superfamily)
MQYISPFLWFDTQAGEAVDFYLSVFKDGMMKNKSVMSDTPSGTVEVYVIGLCGQEFQLMSAGPFAKITPAISFFIHCNTAEEADEFWEKLSAGGKALMEIGEYPFSKRYGWIQDKFGVTWQIMANDEMPPQKIVPSLLFVNEKFGKAGEAVEHYLSVFPNSKVITMQKATNNPPYNSEDAVMFSAFTLNGEMITAMDGPGKHAFDFNEAISLMVTCETQEEVDAIWNKLSADPASEQCGWLKDRFGVSWQIVPKDHEKYVTGPDPEGAKRATAAMMKMKKLDIAELKKTYEGA